MTFRELNQEVSWKYPLTFVVYVKRPHAVTFWHIWTVQ